eukprot:TRINITY_DN2584_c0_g3_i5.p1 TRINITY_DN2584_c0_g3~~TRINITY_DN2584_c0_g3_i5.p1  ORF type:complete len:852 (+),score=125.31 TRINITY_DN2584_c0_g3_i5:245-2800(+)
MNVLGAVAKGVGNAVFGSNNEEDMDTAEQLLQRVSEGVLGEDRRQAMQELKDAMMEEPQWALKVAEIGYPVLISVLREDKDDIELIKGTLEVFIACIEEQQASGDGLIDSGEFPFGLRSDYVLTILSLLDKEPVGVNDFYVRYYTLQISNMIMQANPLKLQECILMGPNSIQSLVALLSDRELVRNESLILLLQLCRRSEQAKSVAAQQGAFNSLLNLISEEKGVFTQSVVVMDSLDLLHCLLSDNLENQRMFREGSLPKLINLFDSQKTFDIKEIQGDLRRLKPQNSKNLVKALEVFICLGVLVGGEENQEARDQNALVMREHKLGVACVRLAFMCEGEGQEDVRKFAFRCIATLVIGNKQGREWLAHSVVYLSGGPQSLLLQVLRLAVSGESKEAILIMQTFFQGNENGQIACINDLASGCSGQESSELSEIIIQGFQKQESLIESLKIVCAIVNGNSTAAAHGLQLLINKQYILKWSKEQFTSENRAMKLIILELWCYLIDVDSQNEISNFLLSLFNQQDQLIDSLIGYLMGKIALTAGKQIQDETIQQLEYLINNYKQIRNIYGDIRYGVCADWPIDGTLIGTIRKTYESIRGPIKEVLAEPPSPPPVSQAVPQSSAIVQSPISEPAIPQNENNSTYEQFVNLPPPVFTQGEGVGATSSPQTASVSPPPISVSSPKANENLYGSFYEQQQQITNIQPPTNGSKGSALQQDVQIEELLQKLSKYENTIQHLRLQVEQKECDVEVAQQEAQQHKQSLKRLDHSYQHLQQRAFELENKLQEQEKSKGLSEEEVAAKIKYEVEKAQSEGEEAMADLLVCLGEEEAKVAILSEKLRDLGEDPEQLIQGIQTM